VENCKWKRVTYHWEKQYILVIVKKRPVL
jgi:hypothetical protein